MYKTVLLSLVLLLLLYFINIFLQLQIAIVLRELSKNYILSKSRTTFRNTRWQ